MSVSNQKAQIIKTTKTPLSQKNGRFIVFEGSDGTGKSSQLLGLHQKLSQQGYSVLTTREPSDGRIGKKIRNLFYNRQSITPEEELQLFLDDRRDHLQNKIIPALEAGSIILCDRYFLSTVAYQSIATDLSAAELLTMNSFAPAPDIALLLHAPLEICLQRIMTARGEQPNDFEQHDYLQKVINVFGSLDFPWLHHIDASGNRDTVAQKIERAIQPFLPQL